MLFPVAPPHLLDLCRFLSERRWFTGVVKGTSPKERSAPLPPLAHWFVSGGQMEERPSQRPATLDVHHSDTDLLNCHLLFLLKETAAWHLKKKKLILVRHEANKNALRWKRKASYRAALTARLIGVVSQAVSSFAYRVPSARTHGHQS